MHQLGHVLTGGRVAAARDTGSLVGFESDPADLHGRPDHPLVDTASAHYVSSMAGQRRARMTGTNDGDSVVIEVRPARSADLIAMDAGVPAPGSWNTRRLRRHLAGETVLLLAFDGASCVGRAELLLAGSAAAEVQVVHPGVPEINGVEVAATRRGQGIGNALLKAAARAALERGHERVGIGVAPDNPAALRLYERLGFTGSLPYVDRYSTDMDDGRRHDSADTCLFLTASSSALES